MAVREKSQLADLRRRHRGPVVVPDDDAYEAARTTFNGMLDRRPEVITRPLDVDDVVSAVSFAVESDLPIAVRGGGALWEDLDPPCLRHGLATPGGTFGDTGVAGLTLGGGIGHLIGQHGLTLDNLLAATVVTADGSVVRASEDENSELFWALRGGGGNFGVVVDFMFRLHPVGRLLGRLLSYRLADGDRVFATWRELMAAAPDHLVCFALVARSGFTDRVGAVVSVAYFGDV